MKIEAGDDSHFLIDGIGHQRGRYDIFVNSTRVGLRRQNGEFVKNREEQVVGELSDFTNASDAQFADIQAFADYVKGFIFIKGSL